MPSIRPLVRTLCVLLFAAACGIAAAQARNPASAVDPAAAPAETEARNAASGFMLSSLATLGMLRDECEPLLGPGADGAPAIARGWWDRNLQDITTAHVWTDRFLHTLRQADPDLHEQAARRFAEATSEVVRRNAGHFFRGQLPTAASCRAALQAFAAPRLDIAQLGANPGHALFASYGHTLERIRADAGYGVPSHIRLDPAQSLHRGLAASLLAAQAAVRRRDADAVRTIYAGMARRGDAKAAYTLGAMHLAGELVGQDDRVAYGWFHHAWLLRDAEGVNALGVLHRDGRVGKADRQLALALFQLAVSQASERPARSRAQRNLMALAQQMPLAERQAAACMTLGQIAAGVERPLPPDQRRSGQVTDPRQDRRLVDVIPQVAAGKAVHCG